MAKIIPSGVIQLPNFAELQYKLDRQKQSDEMAVARDLAQYKRQSGVIAPGAMPLVQQSFDAWQEDAKKYAADPSASNFAKLSSSYEGSSQAHGSRSTALATPCGLASSSCPTRIVSRMSSGLWHPASPATWSARSRST